MINDKFCEGREYCSPCNTFEYYMRSQSIEFNDEPVLTCFSTLSKKKKKKKKKEKCFLTLLPTCYLWFVQSLSFSLSNSVTVPFCSFFKKSLFIRTDTYIRKENQNEFQISIQRRVICCEEREKMALSLTSMMRFPSHKLSSKPLKLRSPKVFMASTLDSNSK